MPGVTAKDIAKKLGLSPAAVSLALNGKPGVSEDTRALVLETAMQMGYAKLETASATPTHKTLCFIRYAGAAISIAEQTSFSSFVLQGAEARAAELGYTIQVRYYHIGELCNPQTLGLIRKADGIIFLGTDITKAQLPEIDQFFRSLDGAPVVVVDNFLLSGFADCVGNDAPGGARSAVEYLLKTGHKKIGYVRALPRIQNFLEREQGLQAALSEAGQELACTINVDISSEGASRDFEAWLSRSPELPDALYTENDIVAAAVMRVLRKHGYRIPEDVSVVGFDDIPMCEMLDPPLATVRSYKEELGSVAVDLLHRRFDRSPSYAAADRAYLSTVLSTKFIRRASVK